MKSVARVLELSLASNIEAFGRKEARRSDIRGIKNPVKRAAALAVDELAASKPSLAVGVLDLLSMRLTGLHFVGIGAEYSVYGDSSSVTKVHRDSANWSEADRVYYITTEKAATNLLCVTLGSMAINQDYKIGQHPFGRYRVVMAQQPFIDGQVLPVFNTNQTGINHSVVAEYCEDVTGGQAALSKVVEATHQLYDQQHMVPDTNGSGNLVVAGLERTLTIIDPQPVKNTEVADLIRHQVDNLAAFLAVS